MFLDAGALSPEASYRLSSGSVVPRPIAWITTVSADGVIHLARFSCVTFVSNKPPLPGVDIGDAPQMRAIHDSSAGHASGVGETELLGLGTRPCRTVRVPRLADAPLSMECRLERVSAFGQTGAEFIVGAVMAFTCATAWRTLNPVCRTAGRTTRRWARSSRCAACRTPQAVMNGCDG